MPDYRSRQPFSWITGSRASAGNHRRLHRRHHALERNARFDIDWCRTRIQSTENCSQLKADKSQSDPADGKGQWYAGRDRNNKPGHLTAHGNRSCSASPTVAGPPDEEFQGQANSCRSGSGPFGGCALPDVFELWWPSVFTPVLG
jgi:hypothetical protein